MKFYNATLSIDGVFVGNIKSIGEVDYPDSTDKMTEKQTREMVRFRLDKHWNGYLRNRSGNR